MVKIDQLQYLQIGVQGENLTEDIEIDISAWVEKYGPVDTDTTIGILFRPYNSEVASPMASSYADGVLTWTVTISATTTVGVGYSEIRMFNSATGLVKKSRIVPTAVENSVTGIVANPPEPYTDWYNAVLAAGSAASTAKTAAEAAQSAAEAAMEKYPRIDTDTGTWLVWDATEGDWVDTEVTAVGPTGATGVQGPQGIQGPPGDDGAEGTVMSLGEVEFFFRVEGGHLLMDYEGQDPPNFEIDEDTGHLIYVFDDEEEES